MLQEGPVFLQEMFNLNVTVRKWSDKLRMWVLL